MEAAVRQIKSVVIKDTLNNKLTLNVNDTHKKNKINLSKKKTKRERQQLIITKEYRELLEDLSESIIKWQQKEKLRRRDKRFSAMKFLSTMLGYKDPNIIWKFLDAGNVAKCKLGFQMLIPI